MYIYHPPKPKYPDTLNAKQSVITNTSLTKYIHKTPLKIHPHVHTGMQVNVGRAERN